MLTIEEHYSKMLELFGALPSPDHEPKKFEYFVKLYKHLTK